MLKVRVDAFAERKRWVQLSVEKKTRTRCASCCWLKWTLNTDQDGLTISLNDLPSHSIWHSDLRHVLPHNIFHAPVIMYCATLSKNLNLIIVHSDSFFKQRDWWMSKKSHRGNLVAENQQTKGVNKAQQTRDTITETWLVHGNSIYHARQHRLHELHHRYVLFISSPAVQQKQNSISLPLTSCATCLGGWDLHAECHHCKWQLLAGLESASIEHIKWQILVSSVN